MIFLETTAKVRRHHFVHGKSSRERGIGGNPVRRIRRSGMPPFDRARPGTPMPKPGAFVARLDAMPEANERRPRRS
jgi:hypothetical protein